MNTTLPITPETVTRVTLDNGLTILVKYNPNNASVTLRGRLRAGGMFDTSQTTGLAHFTTAALQRGTRKRTFQKLNEELDRYGMSFGIGAGTETIGFSGKALVEDFDRLLDVVADVLMHPTFPRREVEKLRTQILTDLQEDDQDTQHVAYREFRKLCYPATHPYHRLPDGTTKTVKRLTIAQMCEFHARYFRPDVTTLVVVGDVRADDAIARIARVFGRWRAEGAPPPHQIPDAPPPQQIVRRTVPLDGKTQADVVLGFPALRRSDPDFYALSLGDLIFGRLGLYGRLGANVRDEQGLAYYVFSSLETGIGAGPWTVRAGVNPKNLTRAIESILAEIQRLRSTPVTQDELDEARDFLTGSLALRLETNDGVAAILSDIELFNLGLDYLQRYPHIIRSITAEQILAVVQKYARIENYALAIAGPVDSETVGQ
ncbi:MAG: insulinase family protein [Anaerolineae bacterium]|nr:insulinase family protein [Anaerolineae bacterium]